MYHSPQRWLTNERKKFTIRNNCSKALHFHPCLYLMVLITYFLYKLFRLPPQLCCLDVYSEPQHLIRSSLLKQPTSDKMRQHIISCNSLLSAQISIKCGIKNYSKTTDQPLSSLILFLLNQNDTKRVAFLRLRLTRATIFFTCPVVLGCQCCVPLGDCTITCHVTKNKPKNVEGIRTMSFKPTIRRECPPQISPVAVVFTKLYLLARAGIRLTMSHWICFSRLMLILVSSLCRPASLHQPDSRLMAAIVSKQF